MRLRIKFKATVRNLALSVLDENKEEEEEEKKLNISNVT